MRKLIEEELKQKGTEYLKRVADVIKAELKERDIEKDADYNLYYESAVNLYNCMTAGSQITIKQFANRFNLKMQQDKDKMKIALLNANFTVNRNYAYKADGGKPVPAKNDELKKWCSKAKIGDILPSRIADKYISNTLIKHGLISKYSYEDGLVRIVWAKEKEIKIEREDKEEEKAYFKKVVKEWYEKAEEGEEFENIPKNLTQKTIINIFEECGLKQAVKYKNNKINCVWGKPVHEDPLPF